MCAITLASIAWLASATSVLLWAAIRPKSRAVASVHPPSAHRVCLVRPCAGDEPELLRTLSSRFSDALGPTGSFELRILFAVADERDRAYAVACEAALALGAIGLEANVVLTRATEPNRKAAQVACALRDDPTPFVVIADSDVDLSASSLGRLLAPLVDGSAAAAWSPPIEVAPRTLADRASASILDASMHAFAVVGVLDPGGMVGKLVAFRREDLDDVGGFGPLAYHLGEDVELARRLRSRGKRVVQLEDACSSLAQGRDLSAVRARYARWMNVVRAQRPWLLGSYVAVIAPAAPLLALSVAIAVTDARAALFMAGMILCFRLLVAALARVRSRSRRPWAGLPADALLSDALIWTALVSAMSSSRITWRGTQLRIVDDGLLARVDGE